MQHQLQIVVMQGSSTKISGCQVPMPISKHGAAHSHGSRRYELLVQQQPVSHCILSKFQICAWLGRAV